jgi:glycerol-3-phosphate dehydrogenase (NAD(P)+)
VPCQYIRSVWEQLVGYYPLDVPITSVAKGVENHTLLRPTQVITSVVGRAPVAALSGPSIAKELARCLPATVVAASEDVPLAQLVQEAFSCPWFRVYTNTDLLGVELAGATKNVIALAAGIVDGLKAGDNAKAALVTRGLVEITRLGVAMGARRETFAGLAGLGDLVTTCVSPSGRNRWAGEQIGKGKSVNEVVASTPSVIEGIPTTRSVRELAAQYSVEMPITEAVHGLLFEGKDVIATLGELMSRRLKGEV